MKISPRQKNFIITELFLYIVVLISFILISYFVIYSGIKDVKDIKTNTKELIDNKNNIEKNGISFNDFKSFDIADQSIDMDYIKQLKQKLDEETYFKFFANTGSSIYKQFLEEKDLYIDSILENDPQKEIKKIISNAIPIYSEINNENSDYLSDFKFNNYLENIIKIFNLNYKGSIGIGNIVNYDQEKDIKISDLDSGLYYIPVNLEVTGKKEDIINFIHFFENVGYLQENGSGIYLYKDNFINNVSRTLSGARFKSGYNIYDNQLANIKNIRMQNYLDSSLNQNFSKDLLNFVKTDLLQKDEEFTITISLKFFILGSNNFQTQKYISGIINDYNKINSKLDSILGDKSLSTSNSLNDKVYLNKIKEIKKYINTISKDVLSISGDSSKKEDINVIYKKALNYDNVFKNINTFLENKDNIVK